VSYSTKNYNNIYAPFFDDVFSSHCRVRQKQNRLHLLVDRFLASDGSHRILYFLRTVDKHIISIPTTYRVDALTFLDDLDFYGIRMQHNIIYCVRLHYLDVEIMGVHRIYSVVASFLYRALRTDSAAVAHIRGCPL
jgi:hypothetical protein